MPPGALACLPGSTADPGSGPVEPAVLDGLLDDGPLDDGPLDDGPLDDGPLDDGPREDAPGAGRLTAAVAAHRAVAGGDHRDLVATLVVPAYRAAELPALLTARDLGTRVLLASDEPDPAVALHELEVARSALWRCDDVEVVGQRLRLPPGAPDPVAAVEALLAALTATVPSWLAVPVGAPAAVLDVLARDGAENVTLDLAGGDPLPLARLVRDLVDRDLTFRATGAAGIHGGHGPGVLNVLCAVRAALNGAEAGELTEVLAAAGSAGLTSAMRRMSAADAAVTRAFLVAVEVADAGTAVAELADLGLLDTGA